MIKLIIHWQKAKLPAWTDTMEALILAWWDYGKAGHGIWDTSSSTMSAMSTELIPSSINIIKIHIYSWLCALFSFPPSLCRCVKSACSLVLPFKISLISTETFLWAPHRPMLFSVYFSRKTFWQKTKASCHLWVYISVLFYLTTNLI